ncbi:MAG: ATP-binding protein [Myxococcota bacterium]
MNKANSVYTGVKNYEILSRELRGKNYGFVKELVINSIDADSNLVEIDLSRENDLSRLTFRDYGKGMSQKEIVEKLLRFPGGDKKNNFLKVGSIGIGFSSIFKYSPPLVLIRTGKFGQYHDVFLKKDGSYQIFSSPEPFDGTSISVFLEENLADLQPEIERVLNKWFSFAFIPVFFNKKQINRPFSSKGTLFSMDLDQGGTFIQLSIAKSKKNRVELYNQGIFFTSADSPFPHLKLKISSPYLDIQNTDPGNKKYHLDLILQNINRNCVPQLKNNLSKNLEKVAATGNDRSQYRKLLLAFKYLLQSQFSHDLLQRKIFPTLTGTSRSIRNLLESERVYLIKTKPQPAVDNCIFLDGNLLKKNHLVAVVNMVQPGFNQKIEQFNNHFAVFAKTTSLSEIENNFLNKLQEFLKQHGIIFEEGVFLIELKNTRLDFPWFIHNAKENIIDFSKLGSNLSDKNKALLLQKNNPYIIDFLKLAKKNFHLALLLFSGAVFLSNDRYPDFLENSQTLSGLF